MSEAPERIWSLHYECEDEPDAISIGYPERFFGAHEYVRADRIEELEAKLAKVVEALEYYAAPTPTPDVDDSLVARTTLAELKGEK
jgi:hypothetical protein